MKYVHDIHNTMLSNNLILVYEGEFTQNITKSVLSITEKNLESFGEGTSIKRKVLSPDLKFYDFLQYHLARNIQLGRALLLVLHALYNPRLQ